MQLTTEQRLQKAVAQLMRKKETKWLSGVLLMGKRTVSTTVPTAATNGVDEYYNPNFVDKLSEPELRGLVLHETLHKAYRQLSVWKHLSETNHRLANCAADYVINLLIVRDLQEILPEGALLDDRFAGMDTGQVFRLLQQEKEQGDGNGDGGEPLDSHDWENAALTPEQSKLVERALRQGALLADKGEGTGPRSLGLLPDPKVDWRQALAQFLQELVAGGDDSSWRHPRRRGLAIDLYLPSSVQEVVPELVVAVDTSGSIDDKEVSAFLSEVQGIARAVRPARLHLLYWGSVVAGEEVYTPDTLDTLTQSTRPQDGGGTSPSCVARWLRVKQVQPCCVVFLSDGYVDHWPTTDCPQLWVITTTKVAQSGVTIHM